MSDSERRVTDSIDAVKLTVQLHLFTFYLQLKYTCYGLLLRTPQAAGEVHRLQYHGDFDWSLVSI
jgi:hypothetical protein